MRAKFQCNSIEDFGYSKTAKLTAVCGNQGENKDFTEATPWGELKIMIQGNVPAADFIKVGKSYYLDFSEAPE